MKTKRHALLDCVILICFVASLIWPLFRLEYLDNWGSIESTFIADARMLIDNFPHPGWQPLWYCGTRFDFIYPPALRYGTALIAMMSGVSTARAYHLYIAFFYVAGIVAVYWLVRVGSKSRVNALLSAVGTALLSPSFLFLTLVRLDSGYWVPQRLHALMSYGEGPHVTALCILPGALALCFTALRRRSRAALAGSAVLCALVVANNFYGATSLAIFFPIVVWTVWNGERDNTIWLRAGAIAGLAYGLSAFWLTPAYLRITLVNLAWVSQPGTIGSKALGIAVVAVFCALSLRFAGRRPEREWTVFVAGAAALLSLDVLGFYFFGFRVAGEPPRLIPELDLALILLAAEGARQAWRDPRLRIPVVLLLVLAFSPAVRYFRHVWSPFPEAGPVSGVYEYKIADWVDRHLHGLRVLPSGSVRFWFDAWGNNSQLDGGSMQGMINQVIPAATWQIVHGARPEAAVLWMQAMGTDAVVAPGKQSLDHYKDYEAPEKFRGALTPIFDDGHDTLIYAVPRVHPGIGRVVDQAAMGSLGKIGGGDDTASLAKYVSVVEEPTQPETPVVWRNFDTADILAAVGPGKTLLFQETYDPDWRAYSDGKPLAIHREPVMGFMLIDAPEGRHTVNMRFENYRSDWPGYVVFGLSALVIAGLFNRR